MVNFASGMHQKKISVGDFVGFLDSSEKGHVKSITGDWATVHTLDGLDVPHPLNKLVKYTEKKIKKPVEQKQSPTPPETKSSNISSLHQHSTPQPEKISPQKTADINDEKKPVIKKVTDRGFHVNPMWIGEDKKKKTIAKAKDQKWEVDLHIEELVDSWKHLTNSEILVIQIQHARLTLEKAIRLKIEKVVFIHGKGKGVLRQELLHALSAYKNIEFYDASFREYGGGATEVKIFRSAKHS